MISEGSVQCLFLHRNYSVTTFKCVKMAPIQVNMSDVILTLEDVLKENSDKSEKKRKTKVKKKIINLETPRGTPKSGRSWKKPKKRFSSIIKTRGYKMANKFEKLQVLKQEVSRARELSRSIMEKKQQEIEKKKERRRKNLQKKEENRLKSEVVQVVKNSAKIKRLKKKALRNIEKRDTLNKP